MDGQAVVSFLAGLASGVLTHSVRSMVPGSYVVKVGAQVGVGAALTGAAYLGGANPMTTGAVAVGSGAAVAVHVADQLQVSQAVGKLTQALNSTNNTAPAGAANNTQANANAGAANN
jgi:hypothetical protein